MEERRREGARLLRAGKLTKAEIARHLGVSRATVGAWAKVLKAEGLRGLRQRKSSGRVSRLTAEYKKRLKRLLDKGAMASGYPTDRWTLVRVSELIKKEFSGQFRVSNAKSVLL